MSLERLKHLKFDHTRPLEEMPIPDILQEFLYLESGFADELEKGVQVGLPTSLINRHAELEGHIVACMEVVRFAPRHETAGA